MHLKNKSEINQLAAELLQKNSLYPSVVHCAYYSCVQVIKDIVLKKMQKTDADLIQESKTLGAGSHEILISNMNQYLKDNGKNWSQFNKQINQLKRLRVIADYENQQIGYEQSSSSITLSKEVLTILK